MLIFTYVCIYVYQNYWLLSSLIYNLHECFYLTIGSFSILDGFKSRECTRVYHTSVFTHLSFSFPFCLSPSPFIFRSIYLYLYIYIFIYIYMYVYLYLYICIIVAVFFLNHVHTVPLHCDRRSAGGNMWWKPGSKFTNLLSPKALNYMTRVFH